MALVPSVTELLVAEMLYLQYDQPSKVRKERARGFLGRPFFLSLSSRSASSRHALSLPSLPQPIYLYINSAGVSKGGGKLGFEAEALAIYDTMCHVKPPVRLEEGKKKNSDGEDGRARCFFSSLSPT